jgi:hypothetical protein
MRRQAMRLKQVMMTAAISGIFSVLGWQALQVGESRALPKVEQTQSPKVWITEPKNRDKVPERPYIEGKVSNANSAVWLVVHPMEGSDYWVQPQLTVNQDGTWRVDAYLGRPGGADAGKHFEIMAIANPKRPLKEGDVLRFWPDAESKSAVVEVVRK